ncbi:GNAT family N-acetyltransferase [Sphingomonas sp.]|uniref:GNAT family N-acetyltransferase n=1 Tax=Sphingomonas sp. TaxID=28214 RepID=UPI0035BBB079
MSIRLAVRRDADAVAAMLARAFADDPAFSWIFPDPAVRARKLPRLFRLILVTDAAAGMALVTSGGEAATLWRAPGRAQVSPVEMLRQAISLVGALGGATGRALRVSDAIGANMPKGDFWYLHVAGCEPAAQGHGLGGEAIRAGLRRAAGRLPAYLETATERNVGFYRSLGFAVTGEWDVPRGGPHFWSMLRAPG